jgi:hypothetical protein
MEIRPIKRGVGIKEVIMTVMFYESLEDVQNETVTAWTEVASKSGILRVTGNFLQLYAEYGGSVIDVPVGIRVLINGVEKGFDHHAPIIAGLYKAYSVFGVIEPSVAAEYTISLEVRALDTGQTVNVRRIRLKVQQV